MVEKTWAQVNSARWRITIDDAGLDCTTDYGVQFDRIDPKHVLHRLHRHLEHFTAATMAPVLGTGRPTGFQSPGGTPLTGWHFDPDVKVDVGRVSAASTTCPGQRCGLTRRFFRDLRKAALPFQLTAARPVTPSNRRHGRDAAGYPHLLLDPASPAGMRTLYATGIWRRRYYKSTDNGKTLANEERRNHRMDPMTGGWCAPATARSIMILARANQGVYGQKGRQSERSIQVHRWGEHWEKTAPSRRHKRAQRSCADPRDKSPMYLAAWGL